MWPKEKVPSIASRFTLIVFPCLQTYFCIFRNPDQRKILTVELLELM